MKIKLLRAWGYAAPGDVLDTPSGVAHLLIQRQIAEPVIEELSITERWNKRVGRPPRQQVTGGANGVK